MFEYKLNNYFDYNKLYENLTKTKSNKVNTTYSNGREGLISQMMMDNFNLELNKDKRFEKGRIINFYEISF